MFSSCSLEVPQVPKLFPRAFPIAAQIYPTWFAQKVQLSCIETEKVGYLGTHLYLFCILGSKEVLPLDSAQCSQNIADGPNEYGFFKNK